MIQPIQGKLKQEKTNDCCTTCGKIDAEENLVLCHCRSTLYCSHLCQIKDWARDWDDGHRKVCKSLQKARKTEGGSFITW